ncbi:MAG: aminotransferase class IV [Burkholderiaceae bacterium]|nr:aminotransferase class IV [Burkholderiaceae bacterium]
MSAPMPAALLLPDVPCWLDGRWLPLNEARVSVLDRGFLFGDGVYEVIPVYGGRLFRFDEHMARLAHSLQAARIPDPQGPEGWLALLRELVARVAAHSGSADQLAYLQVTRGVAPRAHPMPPGLTPTVFLMSQPHTPPGPAQRREGVACVTARDFRWERGDIKSTSLLGGVMARQIAVDRGAAETILLRDSGHGMTVTEGSSSNVWAVLDGALIGVPPSTHTLAGIRIELLRELCEEEGIACHLRPIAEAELTIADEILISSAGRELLPVTRLDGEPVGHGALRGKPGPVYARLHAAYERAKVEQSI